MDNKKTERDELKAGLIALVCTIVAVLLALSGRAQDVKMYVGVNANALPGQIENSELLFWKFDLQAKNINAFASQETQNFDSLNVRTYTVNISYNKPISDDYKMSIGVDYRNHKINGDERTGTFIMPYAGPVFQSKGKETEVLIKPVVGYTIDDKGLLNENIEGVTGGLFLHLLHKRIYVNSTVLIYYNANDLFNLSLGYSLFD